mmetsp:Transcript_13331/g.33961  ORF Transcript_13331/g.33961 Transcript_13331/m.33961 type:complete len:216 (+) Transcript_13331:184-831(+)
MVKSMTTRSTCGALASSATFSFAVSLPFIIRTTPSCSARSSVASLSFRPHIGTRSRKRPRTLSPSCSSPTPRSAHPFPRCCSTRGSLGARTRTFRTTSRDSKNTTPRASLRTRCMGFRRFSVCAGRLLLWQTKTPRKPPVKMLPQSEFPKRPDAPTDSTLFGACRRWHRESALCHILLQRVATVERGCSNPCKGRELRCGNSFRAALESIVEFAL